MKLIDNKAISVDQFYQILYILLSLIRQPHYESTYILYYILLFSIVHCIQVSSALGHNDFN